MRRWLLAVDEATIQEPDVRFDLIYPLLQVLPVKFQSTTPPEVSPLRSITKEEDMERQTPGVRLTGRVPLCHQLHQSNERTGKRWGLI